LTTSHQNSVETEIEVPSLIQPLVTVVITSYNYERYVGETIESVLKQTYPRVEVIVVDDGSTDRSAEVIGKFGTKVTLIRQKNAGCAAARNVGIRHACGDLIAFCDSDDRWVSHKLERQIPQFQKDPCVGLVHSGSRCFDAKDGRTLYECWPRENTDFHEMLEWCHFGLSSAVFSRQALDRVGIFDETLCGTDDWDLGIRIAFHYRVVGVRELLLEYRMHESNATLKADSILKNSLRLVNKPRELHAHCGLCIRARRLAARHVRRGYYGVAVGRAREAMAKGMLAESLKWRARSLWNYPWAMKEIVRRRVFRIPTAS
jgi:glycosyltransferase involved in cell wall biosynthesis